MHQGRISISRPSYGSGKEAIPIKIIGETSMAQLVEVEIGLKEFTLALTGLGHVSCQFDLFNLDKVGKVREHKTEQVPAPQPTYLVTNEMVREWMEPFEVDGWVGMIEDARNGNRRRREADGTEFASVRFERYVDPSAES